MPQKLVYLEQNAPLNNLSVSKTVAFVDIYILYSPEHLLQLLEYVHGQIHHPRKEAWSSN